MLALVSSTAHAAGVEDTVGGTVGLGRAAHFARVNDFMAVWQNPANLAVVPRAELGLELRLSILHACFDRSIDPDVEYKQPGVYEGFLGSESFGKVCNEAGAAPSGNLGWAQSFPGWGYGIGVFTPAGVGSSKYGDDTIVSWYPSETETFTPTNEGVESPNRQMGLERRALTAYLMAGVAAQPIPQLRFGLSAGLGFAHIYNKSVVSVVGGTFRDPEVINELSVTDWAVPRGNASLVYTPLPMLDLFAVATYQGDVDAKGTATLTANGVRGAPLKDCGQAAPGTHCKIDDIGLTVPFPPLEVTFGARFALKRKGAEKETTLDPMRDEVFDIEVDASWAKTSAVDEFKVTLHDKGAMDPDVPRIQFGNVADAGSSFVRQSTSVPKLWRDTWSLRVGGEVQALPEKLSVRAGVSYATSAVTVRAMNIDYWPVEKVGLHVGATMAFGRYRLSAAYAHIFYQSVEVSVGTGAVKDISSVNEIAANAVNEGKYIAAQDVLSLQFNTAF